MSAELTAAGYGPAPAQSMTWRQFWYAWYAVQLRQRREERKRTSLQLWSALLPNAKNGSELLRQMQSSDAQEDQDDLVALYEQMPASVRSIVGDPFEGFVDTRDNPFAWWDAQMAKCPPNSPKWRFYRAGKSAAIRSQFGDNVPQAYREWVVPASEEEQ